MFGSQLTENYGFLPISQSSNFARITILRNGVFHFYFANMSFLSETKYVHQENDGQITIRGSFIAGFWTQGFSTVYMGKPVASRFGQMVRRIQDRLILIPFGNSVYHLLKSVSFNEKRPRKPETNIQKRLEDMKSEFPPGIFQPGK